MERYVDVAFDCIPLRTMARLDPPIDAPAALIEKFHRIKQAVEKHGTHNTYYLHNAHCKFFVTNDPNHGMIAFKFEGVVFTDESDLKSKHVELNARLDKETCPWLEQHVVNWFTETVDHAVLVEFDRFLGAGDPAQAQKRMQQLEQNIQQSGGFVGMHL